MQDSLYLHTVGEDAGLPMMPEYNDMQLAQTG